MAIFRLHPVIFPTSFPVTFSPSAPVRPQPRMMDSNPSKGEATRWVETNITPENQWLEDDISFWDTLFSLAMLVLGRVGDLKNDLLKEQI